MRPRGQKVAIVQGGNCWPPRIEVQRILPPLRKLILEATERELRRLDRSAQIKALDSLKRQQRRGRASGSKRGKK